MLRALQSGEIQRVGGESSIAVDVRVIAATNKDLEAAVQRGEFREDLFFRLNVVPIRSPPLRERSEDVPALAEAFLAEFWKENGIKPKPVDPEVWTALEQRPWPGNVRELRNVVERMAILSGDRITIDDLPDAPRLPAVTASAGAAPSIARPPAERTESLRDYRGRAEREYILQTLRACDWNISKAATLLGVERTNLHKKMRSLGLRREV